MELPAPQVGQLVDLVEIIPGTAVGDNVKFTGPQLLQHLGAVPEQAHHAEGLSPLGGVLFQSVEDSRQVSGAHGPQITEAQGAVGPHGQEAIHVGYILVIGLPPEIEGGKTVFTAPVICRGQTGVDPVQVGQGGAMEIDHKTGYLLMLRICGVQSSSRTPFS